MPIQCAIVPPTAAHCSQQTARPVDISGRPCRIALGRPTKSPTTYTPWPSGRPIRGHWPVEMRVIPTDAHRHLVGDIPSQARRPTRRLVETVLLQGYGIDLALGHTVSNGPRKWPT